MWREVEKSPNFDVDFSINTVMLDFPVTAKCTLDAKGRVRLPSSLLKQLGEENSEKFVIKQDRTRGIVQLYTLDVWRGLMERLRAVNNLIEWQKEYARRFQLGGDSVDKDRSDRILIPKAFVDTLDLGASVVVYAYMDQIEIWPVDKYNALYDDQDYDMDAMAEALFGGSSLVKPVKKEEEE